MKDSYIQDNRIVSISPAEIDCTGAWLFWPEYPSEVFLQSIRDPGQLEPVLLEESSEGYKLITGFKRVWACHLIDRNVQGIIINCSELGKAEAYLHTNLHKISAPAALVSVARFFQLRSRPQDRAAWFDRTVAQFLNSKQWHLVQKWLELDHYWDYYVYQGHVSLETAPWISEFSGGDLQAIEPFFSSLYWSRNNSVSFVKWIYEISKSRDLSVRQVLDECGLLQVLEQDISPKDKQKRILDSLSSRRFPVIHFLHTDFARLQKEIGKRWVWKITPEQNFESNRLYLQAKLDDPAEVEKAVQELQELKETGAFEKIRQWQKDHLQ